MFLCCKCVRMFLVTRIFEIAKPCFVVVEVKELFGSERKAQLYAHLYELLQKPFMHNIGTVLSYCDFFTSGKLNNVRIATRMTFGDKSTLSC